MKLWQTMMAVGATCLLGHSNPAPAVDVETIPETNPPPGPVAPSAKPVQPSAAPAQTPAPARLVKSTPEVDALITQLGDSDFRKRDAAVSRLTQLGAGAPPALKQAREMSSDPEVVSRADSAVRGIEHPPMPGGVPSSRQSALFGPGARNVEMHVSVENGARRVEIHEPGRVVAITEGPRGIEMSVSGKVDGKDVTRNYTARNADELKTQNPEAFELYQRWSGRAGGALNARVNGRHVFIPNPGRMQPMRPIDPQQGIAGGDEVQRMQRVLDQVRRMNEDAAAGIGGPDHAADALRLFDQMRDAQMDARQREARLRAAAALERARVIANARDPNQPMLIADNTKLGVTIVENPAAKGVVITRVIPHTRAERLGLQPLDLIISINGQPTATGADLARAIGENEKPLVIEGAREGKPLKISDEKKPDSAPAAAPSTSPAPTKP